MVLYLGSMGVLKYLVFKGGIRILGGLVGALGILWGYWNIWESEEY